MPSGLPVTIGWKYSAVQHHDLGVYEFIRRREKRARKPKHLTDTYRYRYLHSLGEYSQDEVYDVLAEIAVIQKSRRRSAGAENRDKFDDFFRTSRVVDEVSKLAVAGKLKTALDSAGKKKVQAAEASSKAARAIAKVVSSPLRSPIRSPLRKAHKVAHSPKNYQVKETGDEFTRCVMNCSPKASQDDELGRSMPSLTLLDDDDDDDDDCSVDILPQEGLKKKPIRGLDRLWASHSTSFS
jgi:hypothetical protein